jgi:hypothetical protein
VIDLLRESELSLSRSSDGLEPAAVARQIAFRVTQKYGSQFNVSCSWGAGLRPKTRIGLLRCYNPVTGRWINRDPIEEKGGVNIYSACKNNLILNIDCFGLLTFDKSCDCYISKNIQREALTQIADARERLSLSENKDRNQIFNLVQQKLTRNTAITINSLLSGITVKCHWSFGLDPFGIGIPGASRIDVFGKFTSATDVTIMVFHETAHVSGKLGHDDPDNPYNWGAWSVSITSRPPSDFDPSTWWQE